MASVFKQIVDAIEAELDDSSVEFATGMRNVKKHAGRKRVVWIPLGGNLQPVSEPGGRDITTARQVPGWDDVKRVAAHFQAPDLEGLEDLWTAVMNAARKCLGNGLVASTYENLTQSADVAGHTYGDVEVRVQTMTWNTRFVRESKTLTTVTTATHTCDIDNTL